MEPQDRKRGVSVGRAEFLRLLGAGALGTFSLGTGCSGGSGDEGSDLSPSGLDLGRVSNPFLDLAPRVASRDPALVYNNGFLHCFHTAVEDGRLHVAATRSSDLAHWSEPRRLTDSPLNFSSPGNVFLGGELWHMCVQSYPILPGERYGSEDSRLWLMESVDLMSWTEPRPVNSPGCRVDWTDSRRQIDPYIVMHNGAYWCFYKTSGSLGVLRSDDLETWEEALPGRPVLGPSQTPDGATVENPCVVWRSGEFIMFFARVGAGRGIGVAHSHNLLDWQDVHYLDFPALDWAGGGPSAAMVLDLRDILGCWLMAFHGERDGDVHGRAALGLAWSDDLEHWELPG